VDLQVAYLARLADRGLDPKEAQRLASSTIPPEMEPFVEAGKPGLAAAADALEFAASAGPELRGPGGQIAVYGKDSVSLLSPLNSPNSLRDFIAFEDHARAGAKRRGEELSPAWFERPLYYKGNHRSLVGPDEEVRRPSFTKELDLELEVACIVGTRGRDLDETSAADAIFGYTILNDWSARDVQRAEMASRLGPAKSKDFATSLGPCIVTADELGPNPSLAMTARVNGREICSANLGNAYWSFPKMISFVSQGEDIWPTDIYGSGTPFGGCLLDHGGPYLEPGDVVQLEVEGIGILRNRVVG
jgi:2-keto-4-pentenoate hydratase/2-oxohepta-3-ene-1,7-dioic acid hydratase in catechol pathway